MKLGPVTPIFRIFDEGMARRFYIDWLNFEVCFEHRFEPSMPLYLGLKRDALELHLTEHHGDTTPGTRARFAVSDIQTFYRDLISRPYAHARPGPPCKTSWGELDLTLTDPFGNRLTFHSDSA